MTDNAERNTYFARVQADNAEAGGRFAKDIPTSIVGAGPIRYPAQPASSPWAGDPVPSEAPLGHDVNHMQPVGTAQEIEASLGDPAAVAPAVRSPAVEPRAGSPSSIRRRL